MVHPSSKSTIIEPSKLRLRTVGLYESVVALAYALVKHTSRASRKMVDKIGPKSDGKRMKVGERRKSGRGCSIDEDDVEFEEYGDEGLWQRSILMGDRCQPLDFSGVIYYDCDGNTISQPPTKSPLASTLDERVAVEKSGDHV